MTTVQLVATTAAAAAGTAAAAVYLSLQQPRGAKWTEGRKGNERIYGHRPSMATQTTASCTGSTLLQPLSEIINLPLDQVCVWMKKKIDRWSERHVTIHVCHSWEASVDLRLAEAGDAHYQIVSLAFIHCGFTENDYTHMHTHTNITVGGSLSPSASS